MLETDALDVVNLQAVNGLNAAFLLGNALLPLSGDEVSYRVAAGLPLKTAAIDALEQFLGVTVKVELAPGAWRPAHESCSLAGLRQPSPFLACQLPQEAWRHRWSCWNHTLPATSWSRQICRSARWTTPASSGILR